jgi:lipoprotein NlpD
MNEPRFLISPSRCARWLAIGAAALLGACTTAPAPASSTPARSTSADTARPAIAAKRAVTRADQAPDSAAPAKKPVSSAAKKSSKTAVARSKPPSTAVASGAMKNLRRPAAGPIIQRFDGTSNKGVDFAGAAGDPVYAARDGQVVFASSALRGYGQLVMIKHDATYVTAYAHNSKVLVKEGQAVKRGQEIARMGSSDADRVKLHFEVRQNGKAVDPAVYLGSSSGSD